MIPQMNRWISCSLVSVLAAYPLLADNQSQDAGALYLEGRKLSQGDGGQVDTIRARERYRKAADLGDPRALAWKARGLYWGGQGFFKNEEEARKIFQEVEPQLREMGKKNELDALGSLCRTLATIEPKTRGSEAYALAQKNGIHGSPSDWNTLGWLLADGIGVAKDDKKAFVWYQKAAQAGNSSGQKNLGRCYVHGFGVEQNGALALSWYRKSADQGNEEGMAGVGWCYEKGEGVAKDEKEALRWYQQSAERGEDWSMGQLARMYEEGRGTDKNPAEAFRWWSQMVDAGDFWAPEHVARCHANGIGTPKNPEEAARWYGKVRVKLEEETKKNEAWAWDNLGRFYFNGLGVEKDYAKALEYYRKAAELKSGWAMEQIGWCHEKGLGVPRNENEALRWYRRAAESGQAWSMGQCAIFYENGRGTEKNPTEAFRWWNRKAKTGDFWAPENVARCHAEGIGTPKNQEEAAQWYGKVRAKLEAKTANNEAWAWDNLGRFYYRGLGVEKNHSKALECYRKAAELKSGWAMEQIGWCYEKGDGVAKDEKEALRWYLQAAENGQSWSMVQCAIFYENGRGTEKEPAKAFEWYAKAAELGNRGALENLARCYSQGVGVEKDASKALQYFQQAAEKGSIWAQAETGRCYLEGAGTKQDKKIAMEWFGKAAAGGNRYAEGMYGKALEDGWNGFPDREEAIPWYRKAAEGGNGWAWAALGQALEKESVERDMKEVFRCYQKANWNRDSWGTFLLAKSYAEGTGIESNPVLAADLAERLMGSSQEEAARKLLVNLHWGGAGPWVGASLERGMEHWLILHPLPAKRLSAIYQSAMDLIRGGRPGAVADVLDLFEAKQKTETSAFPEYLKVFRAVTRLMTDRHVPKSWVWATPSYFCPWSERFSRYLREPSGGNLTLSSGHLEIHEKSGFSLGRSSPRGVADLWEHHLQWLARLLAEQESGWYRSFVRSINSGGRAVNLRWLQAGVSRVNEAGRDLVELQSDQLSLGSVGGALLVSRLSENPAITKGLMARLEELESKELKEIKKKERKKSKKKKIKEPGLSGAYEQIRSLGESPEFAPRWWREKGEISFGWGMSGEAYPGGVLALSQHFPFQQALEVANRICLKSFLRTRPDLVLKVGAYVEKMYDDPRFSHLGYGYLETAYETLANEVPESRRLALEALVRWNRARGNGVTADKWEETLQNEISPKQADTEFSRKPKIPEDCKDAANRATSFYEAKRYEDSAKAYEEILQKYPDSLYALSNLGVVRFHQKKYPEAESALRKAVAISRSDAFSYSVLGIVLVQQEKYQEALDILRRAVELDPEDAKTRNYLGISCSRMGLQEEAERECRKAIELDEAYGDGHFNLAVIYATQSPPLKDRAKQHYQRALQLGVPKDKDLEKLIR